MKVNFQKILCLFSAVTLVLLLIPFSAFAEDVDEESNVISYNDYMKQQFKNILLYTDGQITFEEFRHNADDLNQRYLNQFALMPHEYDTARRAVDYIENIIAQISRLGASGIDSVKDLFKDYEDTKQESTEDMKGHGAKMVSITSDYGYWVYYCDYIVVSPDYRLGLHSSSEILRYTANGEFLGGLGMYISIPHDYRGSFLLYGDVRYEDGTQAPTDDEFVQVPDYNFDNAPDKELEELLKKILSALTLQSPDLSSIEGLLQAIYFRLGTLDSDNDNDILSLLNSSINNLIADSNKNNAALIEKLENLKFQVEVDLKGGNSDGDDSNDSPSESNGNCCIDEETKQEILDTLKQLKPDIDDMTMTQKVHASFTAKFSFIEELKSLIHRFILSYANSPTDKAEIHLHYKTNGSFLDNIFVGMMNELGYFTIDLSGKGTFDEYMPTIRGLIAAFIYVSFAWNTYRKIPAYISGGGD